MWTENQTENKINDGSIYVHTLTHTHSLYVYTNKKVISTISS